MFVDLTEICQKIDGYIKIDDRNYSSETLFRMLRRNWLCYLQNKNVSHKTFSFRQTQNCGVYLILVSLHVILIYYAYFSFCMKTIGLAQPIRSKCKGSLRNNGIKFLFSGNSHTNKHCLFVN